MGGSRGDTTPGQRPQVLGVSLKRDRAVWRGALVTAVLLGAAVVSPGVVAAEAQDEETTSGEASAAGGPPMGLEPSPMDLLFPSTRSRHWSLGVQTQRFDPQQEAITTIYPDTPWRLGVSVGTYVRHRIHPVAEVSAVKMDGLALGQFSRTASEDVSTMWVFPSTVGVEYLFDYSWDQLVVPYLGVAGAGYGWREVSPDVEATGIKWGVHGTAGLLLRLNFMETTTHWTYRTGAMPSDAGLSANVTYAWVDSFGAGGLDFSGFQVGLGGFVAF